MKNIADYVADNWPDRKYTLAEIEQRLRALLADGGKGEAVVKITGADEYGPMLEWRTHWVELIGKSLYTAPQAECAPREAVCDRIVCWHNRRCVNDDAATMRKCPHRATSPTPERAQLPDLMQTFPDDDMGRRGFVSGWNAAIGEVAKSERAQESAGVLTDDQIADLAAEHQVYGPWDHVIGFARAVLAANKT